MPHDAFRQLDAWVFDLDHTLYPPSARLFDQIELRMIDFVMDALGVDRAEADRLRAHYWETHGTTLAGLMAEHDLDPGPFLVDVHDISLDALEPAPDLATSIAALPGRKIVYTNGTEPYARRVLEARGLSHAFDDVFGIEHANHRPKPQEQAFRAVFALAEITPERAAMFEDDPRNLRAPHAMGVRTIHVAETPDDADWIHHHTDDLTAFISRVLAHLDTETPHA
jgi:putative hydrolase of the HAD superfamily